MWMKRFLLKKMLVYDRIPLNIRWKKSVSGTGVIYADTLRMMQEKYGKEGVNDLNEVMYNIGYRQAPEILNQLDMDKDLEGCAYVLLTMHRIFGIRSKIISDEKNRIVIHAQKCRWAGHVNGWDAKTCLSIDRYEAGLIEAILPHCTHNYTKRRSCGADVCELVISIE